MRGGEKLAIIRWPGGKGNLLGKLLPLIPRGGEPYTEAFLGGGSVILNKPRQGPEAVNDLDERVVNLFRVLQDRERVKRLKYLLAHTPNSRSEKERARAMMDDPSLPPEERAWAFVVASVLGYGVIADDRGWSISNVDGYAGRTNPFTSRLRKLGRIVDRMRHVQIDSIDAIRFLKLRNTSEAVHYIDPPYHPDTCDLKSTGDKRLYRHNDGEDLHKRLVLTLLDLKGAVVFSCYYHPVYDPLIEAGWLRLDFRTASHLARRSQALGTIGPGSALANAARVETVLLNPKAISFLLERGSTVGPVSPVLVERLRERGDLPRTPPIL